MKTYLKYFEKCFVLFLTGFSFGFLLEASAMEQNPFTISDGNVIQSDVFSMSRGIYTLRSNTLGMFTIPANKVRYITQGRDGFQQQNSFNSNNSRLQRQGNSQS